MALLDKCNASLQSILFISYYTLREFSLDRFFINFAALALFPDNVQLMVCRKILKLRHTFVERMFSRFSFSNTRNAMEGAQGRHSYSPLLRNADLSETS